MSGESMVDLRAIDALRVQPGPAAVLVRVGVVDRLITAQTLLPPELRLLIGRPACPPGSLPHLTGEAVDLSLCRVDGSEPLVSAASHRLLLGEVLGAVDLVTHTEWWHWSLSSK
ncbi:hypothetical protein ACIA8G_30040 [Lentzea sp. NPDC051213]|uniref:hypothetical protein n=1 Tax=Lentzea sp. NPDC051213 TaxID=3364126 RepID=UPI0037B2BC82